MSTFTLTRGSEAALGMLASQAGSETLLLTQPARELRAELSIEPFTSDSGDQLLAVLFMCEQRHSMTLQRNDGANVQHLADWIEAVANGTLDTAEAVPQRADPSDLVAATAAFNAAAHELNAQAEPARAQDELMPDEIHQMAFEEGQPAENGDGYCFTAEEFDLFVERLLSRASRPAQTELVEALGSMTCAYRMAIQAGHARITALGGECDSVERMLADFPDYGKAVELYKSARATLATSPAA